MCIRDRLNLFVAIVVRAADEDAQPYFKGLKGQNEAIQNDIAEIKITLEQLKKSQDK